ncbi:MAG: mannonate dehydratase [Bacteroidota bacterium]
MVMTFRWYGAEDPIPLAYIRQIPGVEGIVSACFEVPVGTAWPRDAVQRLHDEVAEAGLDLTVIESIPVHEAIKLGRPDRDHYIEAFAESLVQVAAVGVPVVCYNFMPVFDWTRTDLAHALPDGATVLHYDHAALSRQDLSAGTGDLPGWATAYTADELAFLRSAYADVDTEALWDHLAYFLEHVVPVAEAHDVRLALHPDDPPWPVLGLPRIITSPAALLRVCDLVESPANGVTFCTGSLGAHPEADLVEGVQRLGARGRIHFVHARNVQTVGERVFHETAHPTRFGDVDLRGVLQALRTTGFDGPMRPDHGRMIWGETGRPGYGLYDRALGATYLQGLWEGLRPPSSS